MVCSLVLFLATWTIADFFFQFSDHALQTKLSNTNVLTFSSGKIPLTLCINSGSACRLKGMLLPLVNCKYTNALLFNLTMQLQRSITLRMILPVLPWTTLVTSLVTT
jgi:hypothetical protein